MKNTVSNVSAKSGMAPGSLVHVGEVHESVPRLSIIDYNKDRLEEKETQSIGEINQYKGTDSVTWVLIEGLASVEVVEEIGKIFDIHHLVLEDILNTHQRPKFEEYDNYLFIVLQHLMAEDKQFNVSREQISILLLNSFVFVFKEKQDELFSELRKRISTSHGRLRNSGSDYLTYAILDTIVDQNFVLIDSLDEEITTIEDLLLEHEPSKSTLHTIQRLKREIVGIRRYISPVRELMSAMLRSDSQLINEKTQVYLRDVSDHATRVVESVESYRDILTSLLDIYISSMSNRMNEVMKVLTVFASIFIPLTFLVGIYGMNFEYMPELKWRWAYPALWVAFIIIPAILLVYFRKKKWL